MNERTRWTVTREAPIGEGHEWCRLEVELREAPKGLELSICGTAGYIVTRAEAKSQALATWESLFEDSPEELAALNERNGTRFRSPRSAARYIVEVDGEFHGCDVDHESPDGRFCYVTSSCGQIRGELARFFPETAVFYKWHLNGMRPSKARVEQVVDAWGCYVERTIPEGVSWEHEELPPEVIAWARGLPGTLQAPPEGVVQP